MVIRGASREGSLAYKDTRSLTGYRQTGCVCFGINFGISRGIRRLITLPMTQVADALKL